MAVIELSESVTIFHKLEAGPEGMTVSGSGVIRWSAPERPDPQPVPVIVSVQSASGKEVQTSSS